MYKVIKYNKFCVPSQCTTYHNNPGVRKLSLGLWFSNISHFRLNNAFYCLSQEFLSCNLCMCVEKSSDGPLGVQHMPEWTDWRKINSTGLQQLQGIQTNLGAHTASSYSMDTWFFPGGMWLEHVADHSVTYNAELIMCGTVPLLLYVCSWCGQQMLLLHLVPLSHISGMLKLKFKCVSSGQGTQKRVNI